MQDDLRLLQTMVDDQRGQSGLYSPGAYWRPYCDRIVSAIKRDGISNFRSNHAISKGYADSVSLDPSLFWGTTGSWRSGLLKKFVEFGPVRKTLIAPYLSAIDYHYRKMSGFRQYYYDREFGAWLNDNFKGERLPETLAGGCVESVEINGRRISINYLTHLVRIFNFSKHIDLTRIKSVFEIGGGYGANAHLLLHLYPNIKKFFYLDIAPVLYVGTQYLKYFFPGSVKDYLQTRDKERIDVPEDDVREIIAILPWQLDRVGGRFDLFWNSASLQEMDPEIIDNYLGHADRLLSDNGSVCVVLYTGGDSDKATSVDTVISILKRYLDIKAIDPQRSLPKRCDYIIGAKRR